MLYRDRGRGGNDTHIHIIQHGIRSVPAEPVVLLPWAERHLGRSRPLAGGNIQPTRRCSPAGLQAERSSPQPPEGLLDLLHIINTIGKLQTIITFQVGYHIACEPKYLQHRFFIVGTKKKTCKRGNDPSHTASEW